MVAHLLLINETGNVMLADAVNDIRMPIGALLAPERQSHVATAVWSGPGQWTAWSVNSAEIDGIRQLRLHDEASDQAGVLVESVSAFYLNPSPSGRWLSHLSPGPLGLELAISEIATGQMHVVERGQPLFWSWSSDSSQLAVHVEDRVLVISSDGLSSRVLSENGGPFVTPWWLPGDTVLFGLDDRIVAAGADDSVTNLVNGGSSGRFALGPDGRQLAYIDLARDSAALVVVDLVSQTTIDVTSDDVISFFWSPDGTRLAVLVAIGDGQVQWSVVDGREAENLDPFHPTRAWATSVLPFFEQYSQSHSCWSPDSTALVAPAIDAQGHASALIQSTDAGRPDQWIHDAALAWWA